MITYESSGSFKNIEAFLGTMSKNDIFRQLDGYAREGVIALSNATPKDSGFTAQSWDYEIKSSKGKFEILWTNSNLINGVPVAILLQYGHGTGTGGYVRGQDYINPALKSVFDSIAERVWKAVTSA